MGYYFWRGHLRSHRPLKLTAVKTVFRHYPTTAQPIVGRQAELSLLTRALAECGHPRRHLHVHLYGPSGIGKTALVRAFAARVGVPCLTLVAGAGADPSGIRPPTTGPWVVIGDALGRSEQSRLIARASAHEALLVTAGRHPLAPALATQPHVTEVPLGGLKRSEADQLLTRLGVRRGHRQAIVRVAGGLPLGLVLGASSGHPGGFASRPRQAELARCVARITMDAPFASLTTAQRRAADLCRVALNTTPALLEVFLAGVSAPVIFSWLAAQSWTVASPTGVQPHPALRRALRWELEWRDPDGYTDIRRRLMAVNRDALLRPGSNPSAVRELFHLEGHGQLGPAVPLGGEADFWVDRSNESDRKAIAATVRRTSGSVAAQLCEAQLAAAPHTFLVMRGREGTVRAFMQLLPMTAADHVADPLVGSALRYVREHAPLRDDEEALVIRHFGQIADGAAINRTIIALHLHGLAEILGRPKTAVVIALMADDTAWRPMMSRGVVRVLPDLQLSLDGRDYKAIAFDFRRKSPRAWLEELALSETPRSSNMQILSREHFAGCVRDALKDFSVPLSLCGNKLLHSRLVVERAGHHSRFSVRLECLRTLLLDAVQELGTSHGNPQAFGAVWSTWIEPADNQRAAAAALSLPFSTYRRHLASGTESVIESLWPGELGRPNWANRAPPPQR